MRTDAIVNTANPAPVVGSGVDSAIYKKAGHELFEERKKIGSIAVGDAVITSGFRSNAKYIIHTVSPVWKDGSHNEEQLLTSCYRKSLKLAKEYKCGSVAFPLIAAGNYGFPKTLALHIAVREISAFLMENEMQIYLVVFGKDTFVLSEKLFKTVSSYIDENYVQRKLLDEYAPQRFFGTRFASAQRNDMRAASRRPVEDDNPQMSLEECASSPVGAGVPTDAGDWGELLKKLDAGFSETLLDLIDQTGKKDSEIYKKANVDRKLFSKIRSNPNYKPSKTTALAFAFALELDIDETKDFIGRAGYALSHSSKFDVIVECFLVNKNYNVFELNEVLFAFDQPLIGA